MMERKTVSMEWKDRKYCPQCNINTEEVGDFIWHEDYKNDMQYCWCPYCGSIWSKYCNDANIALETTKEKN